MENQLLILMGSVIEFFAVIMLFSKFRKIENIEKVNRRSWHNNNTELNLAMDKLVEMINDRLERQNKINKKESENNKTWYIILILGIIIQFVFTLFQISKTC